jgi:hypothetical protein
VIRFDSWIPEEIAIAPTHPLGKNLDLSLADTDHLSAQEVLEIQQRDRVPGIVKRLIPFDAGTFWEYWWCVPDRLLLPEDVELMTSDRDRVESILEKLVWLFGGHCFTKDCFRQGERLPIYDWQEVLKFARQNGFESYLLDIDYLPTAIKRYNRPSTPTEDDADASYIAVEPAHWHIEFFQLTATRGGFELQQPKTVCSCQIWTGKPFMKHLDTSETSIRYDLWVSTPLDFTQTPWSK